HNVERVIYTSSDKAISPTNAMGATKLLAERLISATNYARGNKQTVFTVVRFGNIIASRGSVIPLFMKQIASQGPVTVTCAGMTRFMMSIDQAVRLALEAARLAQGGEVFVLKMPALRLGDLVRVLIAEYAPRCGLKPEDIPVKEIGLRPGEKMHEELMHADEALEAVELARLFVIPSSFSEREHAYPEGQPAQSRSYSSGEQVLLNERQIRDLLCGTGVLPCPANTDSSTMLQATASNIPIHG
ncbi:MAG: polysaccharide biosynthesis protein, partial [Thermacetogeniaceae bacterium]